MPRLLAEIAPTIGAAFTAEIANLTTSTLFIKTDRPLEFGAVLRVSMLGSSFEARVAYTTASDVPRGAVLCFPVTPELTRRIEEIARNVEVLRGPLIEVIAEPTNDLPSISLPLDALVETPEPAVSSIDLPMLTPVPDDTVVPPPVAPAPIAPPPPRAPSVAAPPRFPPPVAAVPSAPSGLPAPVPRSGSATGMPPPRMPPPPRPSSVPGARSSLLGGTPTPLATMPPPAAMLAQTAPLRPPSPPPAPNAAAAPLQAESFQPTPAAAPAPAPAKPAPPAAEPSTQPDFPTLESDGVTLRFASKDQYRAQHKANIAHGGIIARSAPIALGAQKFLGIEIPGHERYTLSARVTFIGEGSVGFVIDSFPLHKAQLKSFVE